MDDQEPTQEELDKEFRQKYGEWVECGKCKALMYETFIKCWSCGVSLKDKNWTAVKL